MNGNTLTVKAIRSTMAESYRRSGGTTVTVKLPGATIVAPAFIDGVNTGQTVLDAIELHREWTGTLKGAVSELATRWQDMLDDPNRPELAITAIHWVLDLNTAVTGAWLD
jgi:hypothetical protein